MGTETPTVDDMMSTLAQGTGTSSVQSEYIVNELIQVSDDKKLEFLNTVNTYLNNNRVRWTPQQKADAVRELQKKFFDDRLIELIIPHFQQFQEDHANGFPDGRRYTLVADYNRLSTDHAKFAFVAKRYDNRS